MVQDGQILKRIVIDAAWAGVIIGGLLLGTLMVVAFLGGIDTSGEHLDWSAVQAIAAIAGVLATVGALGLLRFTIAQLHLATEQLETQAEQLRAETRQQRISRQPYLRVDVGFEEPKGRSPGFQPRRGTYTFSAREFRGANNVDGMAEIAPASVFDPAYTFCVWVTNLQQAPVGIAYNIVVRLVAGWRAEGGAEDAVPIEVQFAYLEPGQTTGVRIGKVKEAVDWFVASVQDVGYEDLFGAEVLIERHGAQEMLYNRSGVTNDRSAEVRRPDQR